MDRRSRKVYILWGVALTLLLAAGLFCWIFLYPILKTRALIAAYRDHSEEPAVLARQLGTAEQAVIRVRLYLKSPEWLAPYKKDSLALLRHHGKPAVPVLVEALAAEDPRLRRLAASSLGKIGPTAREATADLAKALSDPDILTRSYAAEALGRVGGADAVSALVGGLADEDFLVRMSAAQALGLMGTEAQSALPALEKALDDEDKRVQKAAADALKKVRAAEQKDK